MKIAQLFSWLFACALCVAVLTPASFAQNSCTGLCLQQVSCNGNTTTSVSGTVYAPNGTDFLPNVVVYVPNGGPGPGYGVQPLAPGVSNPPTISGSPLVSTVTSFDGTFTITNMPVGSNIPLVIQIGKWRRLAYIPDVAACTNTALSASSTSLPQAPAEYTFADNIPAIGVVTGSPDNLECSLSQIGIKSSQFTDPGGSGAVSFYLGDIGPGAQIDANTPTENSLWTNQSNVNSYDVLLLPDQGTANDPAASPVNQQELINFANAGGRVFTSHFSYDWLYNDAPFSSTAIWDVSNDGNQFGSDPGTGLINTGDPRGVTLAQWLLLTGASVNYGQITIDQLYDDFTGVVSPSFWWLSVNDPLLGTVPQLYSFDTPVGAPPADLLGRVLFKDFDGGEAGSSQGMTFPAECTAGPMTAEQKLIEYSLFNLSGFLSSFTLSASPGSLSVLQSEQGTSTITMTPANGFNGNVSFSASDLPNGVTAAFNPNPASSTSTLTLTASRLAATGTGTVTVTGTSGSFTQTTALTLTVASPGCHGRACHLP